MELKNLNAQCYPAVYESPRHICERSLLAGRKRDITEKPVESGVKQANETVLIALYLAVWHS